VLAVYALTAGLIVDTASWTPGWIANQEGWFSATRLPLEVVRGLAGLALCVSAVKLLEIFDVEAKQRLEATDRARLVAEERARFRRDLHDGTIQSIYAAGLHLERASADLDADAQPARGRISTVMGELNRITNDIRSTIFDLRSGEVESRDAEAIVLAVADELQAHTLVELDVSGDGLYRPRLRHDQAEHLRHIVTEAFSNVLRHAHARRVTVRMACTQRRFTLELRDDGAGFDPDAVIERGRRGRAQGLANVRRRAELLDATLRIESAPGRGASVSLTMPVATTRRPT
jgi:signal transduction histidine kinase